MNPIAACNNCDCVRVTFKAAIYSEGTYDFMEGENTPGAVIIETSECCDDESPKGVAPFNRGFLKSNESFTCELKSYDVTSSTFGYTDLYAHSWILENKYGQKSYYDHGPLEIAIKNAPAETYPLTIIAVFTVAGSEDPVPEQYAGNYAVPEFVKVTIPDTLDLTFMGSTDGFGDGEGGNGWYCNNCQAGTTYSHIMDPHPGEMILRINPDCGQYGDKFTYEFVSPAGFCARLYLEVQWFESGILPQIFRNWGMSIPGCPENAPLADGVPIYMVPVAKWTLQTDLQLMNPTRVNTNYVLTKTQLLSNPMPTETVVAAYRAVDEHKSGACQEQSSPPYYRCVPTGDIDEDVILTIVNYINPLLKYPSLGGEKIGLVGDLAMQEDLYISSGYDIGGDWNDDWTLGENSTLDRERFVGPIDGAFYPDPWFFNWEGCFDRRHHCNDAYMDTWDRQKYYQFCPDASYDPDQIWYICGCPNNPVPDWRNLWYQAQLNRIGGEYIRIPYNNYPVPGFHIRAASAEDWPNPPGKCKCLIFDDDDDEFDRDDISTTYTDDPNDSRIDLQDCAVTCTSLDEITDCMPRGIKLTVFQSYYEYGVYVVRPSNNKPYHARDRKAVADMDVSWANNQLGTNIYSNSEYKCWSPRYLKAPDDCTNVTQGDGVDARKPFFLNEPFTYGTDFKRTTVRYKLPNPNGLTCTAGYVELTTGWITTEARVPEGRDTEKKCRLFTMCMICTYWKQDTTETDKYVPIKFYAINPGPEFNYYDYSAADRDKYCKIHNPWGYVHDWVFKEKDFALQMMPPPEGHPSDPDPPCIDWSYSQDFWEMSRARKLFKYDVYKYDEALYRFCPPVGDVYGDYCTTRGHNMLYKFEVEPYFDEQGIITCNNTGDDAGYDNFLRFAP